MNSKVSIITPTFNSERFISDTIDSVIQQSYQNFEMIIVDDCSIDKTEEIVKKHMEKDKRIKFYKLYKNSGAAVVRNYGLEKAQGRYIAFLDSDDIWEKGKLEKQLLFMQDNGYAFSFTAYELMDENGTKINKTINVPKEVSYTDLLKNTIIGCLTVIVDREVIGDFRMPLVRAGQDTATWLSILRTGKKAYGLNENLASYRLVKGSISSNKLKALKRTWNVYRNIEKLNLFKCSYYFSMYVFNAFKKRIN